MKHNNPEKQHDPAPSNYDLKSEAVEKLVQADSAEVPSYSQEELDRYRSVSKIRIPMWAKILFIKAWFAGAICFFFLWGLGSYVSNLLDMLFILGVVLGVATDILVNNIIRFIETVPGENDGWMLFPKKGMLSFFLNIVYAFVIIFCVYHLYIVINYAINLLTGNMDSVPLGVEPLLFGVFCMGIDVLFVFIKRVFSSIIRDAKNAAAGISRDETSN